MIFLIYTIRNIKIPVFVLINDEIRGKNCLEIQMGDGLSSNTNSCISHLIFHCYIYSFILLISRVIY